MATVFDYVKWRGDLTFTQDPPNEVDALIFSCLAYVQFGGMVEAVPSAPVLLRDAAEEFFSSEGYETRARVKNDLELLQLAAGTTRFGYTAVMQYRDLLIPEQETQFGAMTFRLDDGSLFVAFRGTDNTLVGWKEDFNMSFQQTVPAQRLAQQYVREIAAEYDAPLRLGGHSKGGNLAVFAAARSSPMVQERILEVYNNDGPGFTKYMMGDPGYLAMVPRIRTHIPQSSVIGMLLEHEEPYTVIRSKTVGLLQHDPYSWELMAKDFILVPDVTEDSRFVDATIKNWFADMTNQERNQLVDMLFTLLGTGGVETPLEILHPKNIRNYVKTLSTDDNLRRVLSAEFQGIVEAIKKTRTQFDQMEQKRLEEETNK
ncbi:MAG: DUF2974 domain-containing protein [Oscillospiraceae bacterium]|nr:DUF2974 domain-containing protein [Oscillospiraceae bacterium]